MAYNPNIPQPTEKLSDSQADLLENFTQLDTYLNINHTAIDGTAAQGKHKFVTLPEQVASPATLANEAALFSSQGYYSAKTELLWAQENNTGTVPFTEIFTPGAGFLSFFLPTGIIIKLGEIVVPAQVVPGNNFVTPAPLIWPVVVNTPAFTSAPFVFAQTLRTVVAASRDIVVIVNNNNTNATQVEVTCQLTTTTWSSFNIKILAIGV